GRFSSFCFLLSVFLVTSFLNVELLDFFDRIRQAQQINARVWEAKKHSSLVLNDRNRCSRSTPGREPVSGTEPGRGRLLADCAFQTHLLFVLGRKDLGYVPSDAALGSR